MQSPRPVHPSLFGRVATLVGGAGAAQLVTILAAPVLTRIYSPEAFGEFAELLAIILVLQNVITLRFDLAVPVADSRRDAALLASLAAVVAALLSSLTLGLLLLGARLGILPGSYDAGTSLSFCTCLFAASCGQILAQWWLRDGRYRLVSVARGIQATVQAAAQAGLGALSAVPTSLLVGLSLGHGSAAALLMSRLRGEVRPRLVAGAPADYLSVARKFWRFPLISTWSALVNSAGLNAPLIVIGALFGMDVLGLYALAHRAIGLPMTLVGQASAQAYMVEAARSMREAPTRVAGMMVRTSAAMIAIALVAVGILALVGPPLFRVVFGSSWSMAGTYIRWLAPLYIAQMAVAPVLTMTQVIERQSLQFFWDVARLVAVLGSFLASWLLGWALRPTLLVYACSVSIVYVVGWLILHRVVQMHLGHAQQPREVSSPPSIDGHRDNLEGPHA